MAEPSIPPNTPYPYGPAGPTSYPQPPAPRSKRPWIIAGIALAAVALAGVAAVLLSRHSADAGYTAKEVANSCDVVDISVIEQWVPPMGAQPEHKETRNGPITMLECSAENKSADESKLASIALIATVDEQPSVGIQPIQLPLGPETTGTDREQGAVTGIGEEAHYYWSEGSSTAYSWVASVYQLEVRDANLDVSVTLQVVGGTKDDLATVAEAQVRQVMDELRK